MTAHATPPVVKGLLRFRKTEPKDAKDAEWLEKAVKVLLKKIRKTGMLIGHKVNSSTYPVTPL